MVFNIGQYFSPAEFISVHFSSPGSIIAHLAISLPFNTLVVFLKSFWFAKWTSCFAVTFLKKYNYLHSATYSTSIIRVELWIRTHIKIYPNMMNTRVLLSYQTKCGIRYMRTVLFLSRTPFFCPLWVSSLEDTSQLETLQENSLLNRQNARNVIKRFAYWMLGCFPQFVHPLRLKGLSNSCSWLVGTAVVNWLLVSAALD